MAGASATLTQALSLTGREGGRRPGEGKRRIAHGGAVIVATALEHGCPVVSKDERIRSFPRVRVIW